MYQEPAGKIKFIVFVIEVMLLMKGMELHRHRFRHGRQIEMTDPLRETDKSGETYEIEETIEMSNAHRDVQNHKVKPSPGSTKGELVQDVVYDEKVTPKPGIRKKNW